MNQFVIRLCLFHIILSLISCQSLISTDPDPIVFENQIPTNLQIQLINVSSGTYQLVCNFSSSLSQYSSARFGNIPNLQGSGSFSLELSNFRLGKSNDFVCSIVDNSKISITKTLTVRPELKGMVCGNQYAVKFLNNGAVVNAAIKFSDKLTSDSSVNCTSISFDTVTSGIVSVAKGSSSSQVTLNYASGSLTSSSSDTVNCTFQNSTFVFNVQFQEANLSFTPSSIVSDSPIIELNLYSNFKPTEDMPINCSIVDINVSDCTTFPNIAVNWTLSPAQITFTANVVNTAKLTMTRTGSMANNAETYAVLCCSTNKTAKVNVTINSGVIDLVANETGQETQYGDLNYVRLSECPCDLTVGVCDVNCCCDQFCNCASNTTRITGPYGGYFNDYLPRNCNYQDQLTKAPYSSILCVMNESPNILGDNYPMKSIITNDSAQIASAISSSARSNVFQIKITNMSSSSQISNDYILASNNFINSFISTPYLYLPKQSQDSGSCNLQNPIIFLQSYQSACDYYVTSSNCNDTTDPRLNSRFYLSPSTVTQTQCTDTLYTPSIPGNIQIFVFYKCKQGNDFIDCEWDNGYNLSLTPVNTTENCENVVESVSYTVYHNGATALYISANILLTNISFNSNLNQSFSVSFVQSTLTSSSSSPQSFNSIQSASVASFSSISGLYGYDDGKPIITVLNISNPISSPIRSFSVAASGICDNLSPGKNILFLQNSLARCKYDTTNLKTCIDIRNSTKIYVDEFFKAPYFAIYGNPSLPSDYVLVNTSNVSSEDIKFANDDSAPGNSMKGFCSNVVTGVTISIYYTRQGKARNQYIHNIARVAKRYQLSNISSFRPLSSTASYLNDITLTYYVEFILSSSNVTGSQSTDNVVQSVCYFDICLNELFYPWMYNYEGKQGFYEETFGIFLLGLAVFIFAVFYY